MEIKRRERPDFLELAVSGRLDAYWADFLAQELNSVIRQGVHQIRLDLAEVPYVSSAGVGVLLQFYQELERIEGSILVSDCSAAVRKILELTGLAGTLLVESSPQPRGKASPSWGPAGKEVERDGVQYEVFDAEAHQPLTCRMVGDPRRMASGGRFEEQHCQTLGLSQSGFSLGLGALGGDFASCRERFGEFLAVAGAAIYQPTDGTGMADYLLSVGEGVPEISVLYALVFEGLLPGLIRFETTREAGPVGLSNLALSCLDITGAQTAAFVVVAESTGLMGAALKRSPASESSPGDRFDHPEIRRWLRFSPERIHRSSVALVAGVASRLDPGELAPIVRPLRSGSGVTGHFHAAAFSYGPLQRGRVDLKETVATLFQMERPLGVLHLLADDRPIVGAGESQFARGACWVGPVTSISVDGPR